MTPPTCPMQEWKARVKAVPVVPTRVAERPVHDVVSKLLIVEQRIEGPGDLQAQKGIK